MVILGSYLKYCIAITCAIGVFDNFQRNSIHFPFLTRGDVRFLSELFYCHYVFDILGVLWYAFIVLGWSRAINGTLTHSLPLTAQTIRNRSPAGPYPGPQHYISIHAQIWPYSAAKRLIGCLMQQKAHN